jgi:uncharacterized membrane protein
MALRNLSKYRISRNSDNPIMLGGLPLFLAIVYFTCFLVGVMLALFLANRDISIIIIVGFPLIILIVGPILIKRFYKKHGLHGFKQSKRDKKLPNSIKADISIQNLLNKNE